MPKSKDTRKCPLCGTKLKIPAFECSQCNKFLRDDDVIKEENGRARCPKCAVRVKPLSKKDIQSHFKCRECGFKFGEIKFLEDALGVDSELTPKEEIDVLGKALDSLSEEIDQILDETQRDEGEVYKCPECGLEIAVDVKNCPGCGIKFFDFDEIPRAIQEEELKERFECFECRFLVDVNANECPKCGAIFLEEVERLFACPACDADVEFSATKCPNCGMEFIIEDEAEEEAKNVWDELLVQKSKKDLQKSKSAKERLRPTKGLTNGLTNGQKRGKFDLTTGVTSGRTNGLTNGITNGLTNGLTNGIRALRMGITNGLTNGNGITNGLGARHQIFSRRKSRLRLIIIPLIVVTLVFSPFIMVQFSNTPEGIKIDGKFGDWSGLVEASDSPESAWFNPNVDIVDFWVDSRLMELSFYLKVDGKMLVGEPGGERYVDTAYIFIDTDQSPDSGYYIKGIGADFMAEIYGWEGEVIGSTLYSYENDLQDWNLWKREGGIGVAPGVSELEAQVSYESLNMRESDNVDVLFYMQSWDGFEDFSDYVISNEKGVLTVSQQGFGEDAIFGNGNRLLALKLEALYSDISVTEIIAERIGVGIDSDIVRIRLEDESGSSMATGTLGSGIAIFRPELSLSEGEKTTLYIVVDVSGSVTAENSIGFKIANNHDIHIEGGTVSLSREKPEEGYYDCSYVLNIPSNITIDGAFADWNGKLVDNDTTQDVDRANIDIQNYGVSNTEDGPAFYLDVDGEICGGYTVPYWNTEKKVELVTGGDVGIGGEPPQIPPKTGEDVVYIFIDSIPGAGYAGLPIGADYMIEVIGRHNMVQSSLLYEWSGAFILEWSWTAIGQVDIGLDSTQMEVSIDWDDIIADPFNEYFEVFFWTTDWKNSNGDYSDDTLPFSLNQTIMDNLLVSRRGTRTDYTSDNFHPTAGVDYLSNSLTVSLIDEDAPGNGAGDEESWAGKEPNMWGECEYGSGSIPTEAEITAMTVYMGYHHTVDWVQDSGHWGVVWSTTSDGTENPIANYSTATSDNDEVYTITTNLPSVSEINNGIFIQVIGTDTTGGPDTFYLDYLYFNVSYSLPDIVINEVMSDPSGGPYDGDWNCRKKITIHSLKVTDDLTDFPMLIDITDDDLKNKARSDGYDILFTASDNETKLDHEIERYNSTTGELIAWIKIPLLSSTVDTVIYMYYNNSDADNQQNPEGVWSNSYVGVYHMLEETGNINNSASSTNDGTRVSTPTRTTGQFGYGQSFLASDSEKFNIGNLGIADGTNENITFSAWAYVDDSTLEDWGKIISKRDAADTGYSYVLNFNDDISDKRIFLRINDVGSTYTGVGKSSWVYLVGTYNGTRKILYINGTEATNQAETGALVSSTQDVTIGGRLSNTLMDFSGIIDEPRISNVARSAEWIETEWNNQFEPSSFYTVNDEDINPTDWSYRKPITINSSQVTGDLNAFPVLIDITDSDLSSDARSDGYDIIFTDWDGKSKLYHEIESYTNSSGNLIAWVKIASLSSTSDTLIYMYYGNSSISSPTEEPAGVWDDDFVGVWHLNETGDGTADEYADSSKYDNHGQGGEGTASYVPARVGGKIAGAQDFDDDLIDCGNDTSLKITGNQITLEAWITYPSATHAHMGPLNHKGWSAGYRLLISENSQKLTFQLPGSSHSLSTAQDVSTNTWHHIVAVYDSSKMYIYLDGSKDSNELTKTDNIPFVSPSEDEIWIGHGDQPKGVAWSYPWDGMIDEVRISNTTRSTDWIATEYNNQNDTSSFLYTGSEESTSGITSVEANYEWVELHNTGSTAIDLTGWKLTDNDGFTFNVSGAGTIPSGGYLICHLGESGTNSSTDVYGPIINSSLSPKTMLENTDDLGLLYSSGEVIDYIAWGGNAGQDDDDAVSAGLWTDGEYIETSDLLENETIGLDKQSTDTDTPSDWETPATGKADPYGIHSNAPTPGAINLNLFLVINEIMYNPTAGPYESDWGYKKMITINASQVPSDQTNFPVLISITDSDLASKARSDGYDIMFVQSDNETLLDYEIERYESGTGELIAWVKIPDLSSSTDTEIYMFYNNSDAQDHQNVEGVWSEDYVGVYHMVEGTGNINNSASSTNDGTRVGTPTQSTGFIGYAQDHDGGSSSDKFNLGDLGITDGVNDEMTMSAWISIDFANLEGYAKLIQKRNSDDSGFAYYISFNDVGQQTIRSRVDATTTSYQSIGDSVWVYVVASYDGSDVSFYMNATLMDTSSQTGPMPASSSDASIGGRDASTSQDFAGIVDEVRFSRIARTPDWIRTEYNNQVNRSTFVTVETEASTSGNAKYEWVELYNAGNYTVDLTGWYLTDNDGNTFYLSGAGRIPVGGYVVCHIGESGTNSSTHIYGSIINSGTPTRAMLENTDDLSLLNIADAYFDYVVWGGDAGADDDAAVASGDWDDGNYVDTSLFLENQTLGRDKNSNDTHQPVDWGDAAGIGDPFGIDRSTENGSTPNEQNIDYIPEFEDLVMPCFFIIIMIAIYRRKKIKKKREKK